MHHTGACSWLPLWDTDRPSDDCDWWCQNVPSNCGVDAEQSRVNQRYFHAGARATISCNPIVAFADAAQDKFDFAVIMYDDLAPFSASKLHGHEGAESCKINSTDPVNIERFLCRKAGASGKDSGHSIHRYGSFKHEQRPSMVSNSFNGW